MALTRSLIHHHFSHRLVVRGLSSTLTKSAESSKALSSSSSSIPIDISNSTRKDWRSELQFLWEQASGDAQLRLLKDQVSHSSSEFDESVRQVARQRRLVETCQKQHEEAYQKHASLLMKREQWTPNEAALFVEITSQEVKARQAMHEARQELHECEERASRLQQTFMDSLRKKYEEEQAWQDRWRVMGTFGTWSLIGLNSLVFLLSQVLFYRREARRLIDIESLIKNHNSNQQNASAVGAAAGADEEEETIIDTNDKDSVTENVCNVASDEDFDHHANVVEANNPQHDEERRTLESTLNEIKHEIVENLHVPSAAVGATASAIVCILVGVILQKR